jgi:pyruvate-formate lyase
VEADARSQMFTCGFRSCSLAIFRFMRSSRRGIETMWDGVPTVFNIREDFPVESLEKALTTFAEGRGSSIMTISWANPETYKQARLDTEKYDLLRARMGGWTKFLVTMFSAHQAQHDRRPFETLTTDVPARTTHA